MKPPTYRREVRKFIGVVNYYRGIWERISHTLLPLNNITSSKMNRIISNKLSGLWPVLLY